MPFWAFALASAAVLVALERSQPWRSEVGPNVDGLSADGPATRAAGNL